MTDYLLRTAYISEDEAEEITTTFLVDCYSNQREYVDEMSVHLLGKGENPKEDEQIEKEMKLLNSMKDVLNFLGYKDE